ncbi:hypothetical protein JOQ06_007087 [Pogonophryne albipinna]|uniref:Uncharacterized protein n=1 Tax=Pogonophryne albipinna TaxID=1090488 RepID=A0AAD6B0C4_9TELE|nr:hypothetical protein JOQ06_007087 [Pogonophryne albipinna]
MPYGSEDTSSMAIGVSSTLCPKTASRSRSPPLPSSTATAPGVPDLRSPAPAAPLPSRHSPASPSPAPGPQTQGVTPVYTGQRLKRLLDQRWTGHLGTVSVIVNSFDSVEQFLAEIDSSGLPTQLRVEAAGLLKAVQEPHFKFTAVMVHKILALLDPPNKFLQDKKTDLYTGVKVVKSALDCVEHLRSDSEFQAIWAQCSTGSPADASEPAAPPPMKRARQVPTHLKQYVMESTIGQQDIGSETECKRLFFSTLDSVIGEMNRRFLNETARWSRRFVPLTQKILTFWMCRR